MCYSTEVGLPDCLPPTVKASDPAAGRAPVPIITKFHAKRTISGAFSNRPQLNEKTTRPQWFVRVLGQLWAGFIHFSGTYRDSYKSCWNGILPDQDL